MKRGDIYLAPFPFTDGSSSKVRPVLVVSSDIFNVGEDVVFVPISKGPDPDSPHAVFIDDKSPGFAQTGLKWASSVKWTKPMTIAKKVIKKRLGTIAPDLLADTLKHLQSLVS